MRALGVAMALCSVQALAGEGNPGTFGVITGGGEGGDNVGDKTRYYYIYLGAYYEPPRSGGPWSWRLSGMALGHGGAWYIPGYTGEQYQGQAWRLMGGPSLFVILPQEWWFWDGLQAGLDWEDRDPTDVLPLILQNELMIGRGFASTYWNINIRPAPGGGFRVSYLVGQLFLRLAPWLAFGPELRFVTTAPSIGVMARIGENLSEPRWCVTGGGAFDERVGAQWHLDLWFAL